MLEVCDVSKNYEGHPLLRGVSFVVSNWETVCLLGPSGSGKSTLLRLIAALEQPESGRFLWDGQDLAAVPVHQRQFGLMFQDYALFPHRNVAENVAFGLRMQRLPKNVIKQRVSEALEQVNMLSFANRRVTDLSGGEQQRVALARALAPRPRLLMLDEPLGALDRALREHLIEELHQLLHSSGIPAIYVTHDQEEAFALADRLVVLHEGRVEQAGSPVEVYAAPASPWLAGFLGFKNLIAGRVVSRQPFQVQTGIGLFAVGSPNGKAPETGQPVALLLRPLGACVSSQPGPNCLVGVVENVLFYGENFRIGLVCSEDLHLQFVLKDALPVGRQIGLYIDPAAIVCLG